MQYTYTVASQSGSVSAQSQPLQVLFSGESQTKPAHRLGPKLYDFYLMHIVLSGKGTFTLYDKTFELQAGHTFLIQPEQIITYEADTDEPWRYRWVAFKGEYVKPLLQLAGFSELRPVQTLADNRKAAILFRQLYAALRQGDSASAVRTSGLLQLLLSVYASANEASQQMSVAARSSGEQHLQEQIVHYLSTQYTEPVLIEHMAEALGYNRAYLSRVFKKQTGLTPVSFLLKMRLDKAKLLLRERLDLTVEQISASVGLQDALYFSKQFRKRFGKSPTSYRKAIISHSEQQSVD